MRHAALLMLSIAALDVGAQTGGYERRVNESRLESRDSLTRFSAQLNLGDLEYRDGRTASARFWWSAARKTAAAAAQQHYERGEMVSWARMTSWQGVAAANLGDRAAARALFRDALVMLPGDPAVWNRIATSELSHGDPIAAVSAARIAVAHADPVSGDAGLLDAATARFTLARAFIADSRTAPAIETLEQLSALLHGPRAATLRARVERAEGFSVTGTAQGDVDAWTTLATRVHTLLAEQLATRGDGREALQQARMALEVRSDHPPALTLIASITRSPSDFARAFAADPLDRRLHGTYSSSLDHGSSAASGQGHDPANLVMRALEAMAASRWAAAANELDALERQLPDSETVTALRAEWLARQGRGDEAARVASTIRSAALRNSVPDATTSSHLELPAAGATLDDPQLTSIRDALNRASAVELVAALDSSPYRSRVTLLESRTSVDTTTASGARTSGGLLLRFPGSVTFRGLYGASQQATLRYRIVAADETGLVVEPEGLEP